MPINQPNKLAQTVKKTKIVLLSYFNTITAVYAFIHDVR